MAAPWQTGFVADQDLRPVCIVWSTTRWSADRPP